jgi:hypothetical protein
MASRGQHIRYCNDPRRRVQHLTGGGRLYKRDTEDMHRQIEGAAALLYAHVVMATTYEGLLQAKKRRGLMPSS